MDLPWFINNRKDSIGIEEASLITSESFNANRKYHLNTQKRDKIAFRRGYHKDISSQPRRCGNFGEINNNCKFKGWCWICKREGCQSHYHPESEIRKAKDNFHKRGDQNLAEYDDYFEYLDWRGTKVLLSLAMRTKFMITSYLSLRPKNGNKPSNFYPPSN